MWLFSLRVNASPRERTEVWKRRRQRIFCSTLAREVEGHAVTRWRPSKRRFGNEIFRYSNKILYFIISHSLLSYKTKCASSEVHRGVLRGIEPLFHPIVDSAVQRFAFRCYNPLLSPPYLLDLSLTGVAALAGGLSGLDSLPLFGLVSHRRHSMLLWLHFAHLLCLPHSSRVRVAALAGVCPGLVGLLFVETVTHRHHRLLVKTCFLRLPCFLDLLRVSGADLAGGCSGSDDLSVQCSQNVNVIGPHHCPCGSSHNKTRRVDVSLLSHFGKFF